MTLEYLEITNIRIFDYIQIQPDTQLNLIVGANASGKSTILESIHLLGTGRTFSTIDIESVQRHETGQMCVAGDLYNQINGKTRLKLTINNENGKTASINGVKQRQISSLAQYLPTQVISPETHYHFFHNSKIRRGTLDWGLFHVEPSFHELWTRYQKVLQQRNSALKDRSKFKTLNVWDEELVDSGEKLQHTRLQLVEKLSPIFNQFCQELLDQKLDVCMKLEMGWDENLGFREGIVCSRDRDIARGYTHLGPHRCDLKFMINNRPSEVCASQGQLKLFVIALKLAQITFLQQIRSQQTCLLFDDLTAELDHSHRSRLIRLLSLLNSQIFVTSTDLNQEFQLQWPSYKKFHVEHGNIFEFS